MTSNPASARESVCLLIRAIIDLADHHRELFDSAPLDGPVVNPIDLASRPLLSTQTASCRLRFDYCSRLQPSIAAESVSAGQIEERS